MDSQAPNAAAGQWLASGGLGEISGLRPETVHGDSRFDFSFQKDGKQCFLEVKGVTLETEGVCAFPDAPTERGAKHLRGLARAAEEGYGAYVLFVIQMADVEYLVPNDRTDPAFGAALREAAAGGVKVLAMDCHSHSDKSARIISVLFSHFHTYSTFCWTEKNDLSSPIFFPAPPAYISGFPGTSRSCYP